MDLKFKVRISVISAWCAQCRKEVNSDTRDVGRFSHFPLYDLRAKTHMVKNIRSPHRIKDSTYYRRPKVLVIGDTAPTYRGRSSYVRIL